MFASPYQELFKGRHGRDRMVVGLTTTYATSAYHQVDIYHSIHKTQAPQSFSY
jgi:hypothetical protein